MNKEKKDLQKEKLAKIYNKFENHKPPSSWIVSEYSYNAGFYEGRLNAIEIILNEVFGINGDKLK